jgi:hypothetical protein
MKMLTSYVRAYVLFKTKIASQQELAVALYNINSRVWPSRPRRHEFVIRQEK